MSKASTPSRGKNHEDFLKLVTMPALFEGQDEDLDDLIDTFRTNALEDYHAGIEASFLPLLESILNRDLNFYSSDQSCITLFHFLASQHMRTKGIKEMCIRDRVLRGDKPMTEELVEKIAQNPQWLFGAGGSPKDTLVGLRTSTTKLPLAYGRRRRQAARRRSRQ